MRLYAIYSIILGNITSTEWHTKILKIDHIAGQTVTNCKYPSIWCWCVGMKKSLTRSKAPVPWTIKIGTTNAYRMSNVTPQQRKLIDVTCRQMARRLQYLPNGIGTIDWVLHISSMNRGWLSGQVKVIGHQKSGKMVLLSSDVKRSRKTACGR